MSSENFFAKKYKHQHTKSCGTCYYNYLPVTKEPCFECLDKLNRPHYRDREE